jgi:mycofactocin system glycosyltransferase
VPPVPRPLPAGFRLVLDPSVRRPRPEVLLGGSPLRLVRLRPAGAGVLDRWLAGAPVGPATGVQALARRLLDAGMVHPRPPAAAVTPEATIVIPVRDRTAGLAATLRALGDTGPVVSVDDGSAFPVEGATVRHDSPRGPAAARNTGWRAAGTELVAFVDADCEPAPGWLDLLLPHFADAAVGAAAPRIVSRGCTYERQRSPLDLGPREALVRPGSAVAYVPTAALVVRRQALAELGGFDEALRFGEDVDLVWRLVRSGWRVRYEPGARVVHPARPDLAGWLEQRYQYGRSTGPLGVRHGRAVAPLGIAPSSAAVWALAWRSHPWLAAGVAAVSTAAAVRRGGSDRATAGALARLAVGGHLGAGWALASAVRRAWLPPAVLIGGPGPAAAALTIPPLVEWTRGRAGGLGPLPWLLARAADDLAYQTGVWAGVIESRSTAALSPRWWRAATGPGGTPPAGHRAGPVPSRPTRPPGSR